MDIPFPSTDFFHALRVALEQEPGVTDSLDPCEAYCGFEIDQQLYVFEFDGRECVAVVVGGNEIDLDFVLAGPTSAWQRIIETLGASESEERATLSTLIDEGALEIRSTDDEGPELARAALPFLQVFLEQAGSLAVTVAGAERTG